MRYNTISNDEQFLLAKTYLQLGENNKAFNTLSVIHKKSPTFAPAIFELAAQYAKKGNNYESVNYYRKGLKVEPNNIKALNNLAWLLATSPDNNVKDASQALSIAKKIAIDTNHKNPDTLDTLAAAFAANGQFINAVQTLEKAIAILNSNGKKSLSENYKIRLNSYKSKISNQK
jgi:Flp pilus assembly protein TadD